MSDQQLAEFRRFVEDCEVAVHRSPADLFLADLLRPALDEIDRLRAAARKLRRELKTHA